MLGRGGQINFKCHKSYMVKLRGPSSYDTTILHTFLPLLERFLRCLPKTLRDKFQYPVPAEAKLGPAQLNPQFFGFIIFKMEEGEYLAVWHSLAQLIICMTLSQNNEAGKILY